VSRLSAWVAEVAGMRLKSHRSLFASTLLLLSLGTITLAGGIARVEATRGSLGSVSHVSTSAFVALMVFLGDLKVSYIPA